jgi:twinkle protein
MIDADDIDWQAYEAQTEASIKVCPASLFSEQLDELFAPRMPGSRRPRMNSTKLGRELEFRAGEVTVWAGFNGSRKSTVTGQMILDLCSQGERCLVMSFEMLPGRTLQRMVCQAWADAAPTKRQRDEFMRWTDDRLWIFNHFGNFEPRHCLAVLRYFAKELQGTHVVVDSIMKVCVSEESFDEQKNFVGDVIRIAQDTGMHVHLIGHCRKPNGGDESKPPSKYDIRGSSAVSDQVDNVVLVWANKARKTAIQERRADEKVLEQPDVVLVVDKQRNASFEGPLKFWLHEGSFRLTDDRMSPVEPYPMRDGDEQYRFEEEFA